MLVAAGFQTRRGHSARQGGSEDPPYSRSLVERGFSPRVQLVVLSFNPRAETADDLPRNRPDGGGHLARVDALPALVTLPSKQDDFIARLHTDEIGDVDGEHIHRDRADDRDALTSNEHVTAPAQASVESISVAGRHDSHSPRLLNLIAQAVADSLTRSQSFHGNDTAGQRHDRSQVNR